MKSSRSIVWLLICSAVGFQPAASFAQDWTFQPNIAIGGSYNDNIRLKPTVQSVGAQDKEVTGGVASVAARISRRSPTGSIDLLPRIRSSYYGSDSNANSEDYFLDTFWHHDGQTSRWSLTARYADEEVISSELNDPDFDNPDVEHQITDDSGLVAVENRRRRAVLFPRVDFNLSEKTRLGFGASYADVDYDNTLSSLSGYTNYFGETTLSRAMNRRVTFIARVFAGRYEPEESQALDQDSYGGTLGFQTRISEEYTGYVHAGYQNAEIQDTSVVVPTQISKGAFIFSAGLTRQFDVSRVVLDFRRTVDPSGVGQLVERNQARIRYTHDISERTSFNFLARYQETKGLLADTADADRDFWRAELELERRMSRAWSILGRYRYTRQEFSAANNYQTSNGVFLGVRYAPPAPQ